VEGPQLIPFTPSLCAIKEKLSQEFSFYILVKIWILPSAVPAARIRPYSQGANAMQFTDSPSYSSKIGTGFVGQIPFESFLQIFTLLS